MDAGTESNPLSLRYRKRSFVSLPMDGGNGCKVVVPQIEHPKVFQVSESFGQRG